MTSSTCASVIPAPDPRTCPSPGRSTARLDVVRGVAILLALGWHSAGRPAASRPRRPAMPGPAARLGGRRPVLRAQRLPHGPARAARAGADRPFDGRRFTAAPAAPAVAGALRLPRRAGRRSAQSRGRPISGRTPCTCRTTRDVADRICGPSPWRSTSTWCWLCCSRSSPVAAPSVRLLVGDPRSPCWSRPSALRGIGALNGRPERRAICSGAPTTASTRWRPASCSRWCGCTRRRRSSGS